MKGTLGMGNGAMGNGHWAMGIGQWELKKRLYAGAGSNTILSMPHAPCPMPNAQCPITQGVNLVLSFLWFLYFTLDNNATNPVPEISP